MTQKEVEAHTDGACLGNPGPGGYAALLRYRGKERELVGGEAHTTNNRMELMAAIVAHKGYTNNKRSGRVRPTATQTTSNTTRLASMWPIQTVMKCRFCQLGKSCSVAVPLIIRAGSNVNSIQAVVATIAVG